MILSQDVRMKKVHGWGNQLTHCFCISTVRLYAKEKVILNGQICAEAVLKLCCGAIRSLEYVEGA
jgi:hypothetical protein